MSQRKYPDVEYEQVAQDTVLAEEKKQQKINDRLARNRAKVNQKRKKLISKLIAPILLILTLIIAFFLKLTAP